MLFIHAMSDYFWSVDYIKIIKTYHHGESGPNKELNKDKVFWMASKLFNKFVKYEHKLTFSPQNNQNKLKSYNHRVHITTL